MLYATLEQVKLFLGISDTSQDALLNYLSEKASKLIDNYCQRTFETKEEERSFVIREVQTPKLFIPDLITLTSLKIENVEQPSESFSLHPLDAPSRKEPYRWIEFLAGDFKKDQVVKINGTWGYWETVPEEINFACVLWTSRLFRKKDQAEGRVTSESIGDYSVSYAKSGGEPTIAVPEEILKPFKRRELETF